MKLNPKITGGLAWAGLLVILAVPGVDMLTAPSGDSANRVTASPDRLETATAKPAAGTAAQPGAGADAVEAYMSSGKALPSYISDAPAGATAPPPAVVKLVAPTATPPQTAAAPASVPAVKPPVQVASVDAAQPALVAPVPYPASMRPKVQVATQNRTPAVTKPAAQPATAAAEKPLILDENAVRRRDNAVAAVLDDEPRRSSARVVTNEQLEEWDTGSLAEYLERRGYMSESDAQAMNRGDYDQDGFYLDDGPNNDGRRVIRRLPRDSGFFLF